VFSAYQYVFSTYSVRIQYVFSTYSVRISTYSVRIQYVQSGRVGPGTTLLRPSVPKRGRRGFGGCGGARKSGKSSIRCVFDIGQKVGKKTSKHRNYIESTSKVHRKYIETSKHRSGEKTSKTIVNHRKPSKTIENHRKPSKTIENHRKPSIGNTTEHGEPLTFHHRRCTRETPPAPPPTRSRCS
jgi:hypothetical protein